MTKPLVSVVIIGYRRPGHLARTVASFLDRNRYPRIELILADDASPPDEQARMRALPFDRIVFAPRNRGLGANTNAGLAAARGDYVLQLQDDWECTGPGDFIEAALDVMQERPELAFVRLTDRERHLRYSLVHTRSGRRVRVYEPREDAKDFLYTDTPHIKSRAFIEAMGPYLESRYMQRTELDMRDRFNAQSRFQAAFVEGFHVFEHIGADASFNRGLPLARIGMAMDRVPGLRRLAALYRSVKNRL